MRYIFGIIQNIEFLFRYNEEEKILLVSNSISILFGLYKILMDQYYFSPYKLSYEIGLINLMILLIIYIILIFILSSENKNCFA